MAIIKSNIEKTVVAPAVQNKIHFGQVKTADVKFKEKDVEILF